MSILASRYTLALLVPIALAGCGADNSAPTPDYDSLRRQDDTKHDAYPGPAAAGTSQGWTALAPAPGPALNAGVAPGGPGAGDAGSDAMGPFDSGTPDVGADGSASPELAITNNLYVSGGSLRSPTLFSTDPDPFVTITRTGTGLFFIRTTSYSTLTFSWTSTNLNVIGFAVEFGSEQFDYYAYPSATGYASGSGSMLMEISSAVCSQLPSTCYATDMKLYAVTRVTEGGVTAALSYPVIIPVYIDCGGCI